MVLHNANERKSEKDSEMEQKIYFYYFTRQKLFSNGEEHLCYCFCTVYHDLSISFAKITFKILTDKETNYLWVYLSFHH